MKNSGPITKNGIHPSSHVRTHAVGVAGSSKESPPKAAQVAGAGATNPPGGTHQVVGKPSTPGLAANGAAETSSPKTAAETFYPKKPTLRGRS